MLTSSDKPPQSETPARGRDERGDLSWSKFGWITFGQLAGTGFGVALGVVCFRLGMSRVVLAAVVIGCLGLGYAILWMVAMRTVKRMLAQRDAAQQELEAAGWSAQESSEQVAAGLQGVDWIVRCRRGEQEVLTRSRDRLEAWQEAARMARDGEWSRANGAS